MPRAGLRLLPAHCSACSSSPWRRSWPARGSPPAPVPATPSSRCALAPTQPARPLSGRPSSPHRAATPRAQASSCSQYRSRRARSEKTARNCSWVVATTAPTDGRGPAPTERGGTSVHAGSTPQATRYPRGQPAAAVTVRDHGRVVSNAVVLAVDVRAPRERQERGARNDEATRAQRRFDCAATRCPLVGAYHVWLRRAGPAATQDVLQEDALSRP